MAKSKHPPLLKAALADIASMKKNIDKNLTTMKAIAKACASTQSSTIATSSGFNKQYKYLQDVVEKYATQIVEIGQLETDLAEAKGNKKKEAEIKKALAKAEKAGDASRKEYNVGCKLMATLSQGMIDQVDGVATAAEKFVKFTA